MDNDQTRLPDEDPKASLLSAGQTFGQYKVIRLLGRGGMGEVYEVENPVLEKRYALKLLNKEIMSRPDAAERFKREAKVMARFDHPNIVKVDDFGEIEGHAVLRMELVCATGATNSEGRGQKTVPSEATRPGAERTGSVSSLLDLLKGEPLPEELVVDLLKQILEGLSYAHAQGVVHRDLKPSNILLEINHGEHGDTEDAPDAASEKSPSLRVLRGKIIIPKVTDFGLVRLAGEQWLESQVQTLMSSETRDPDRTYLTPENNTTTELTSYSLLGTLQYMSPEQKNGEEADARSDLYAIGLIAFQMLTGHKSPGLERPSEIIPELNPAWDALLVSAMRNDPSKRLATAKDFLVGIEQIADSLSGNIGNSVAHAQADPISPKPSKFAQPPPGWKGDS